ncbi:MAG: hypothetical protein ABII22_02905 [Candidatus Micrarchaeota archaeon]
MKKILLLLLVFNLAFSVLMLEPTKKDVQNGDVVDLGEIGPGQTITLYFHPEVSTGGVYEEGGRYDFAKVTFITPGWSYENSKYLGFPLQVKITAAKDASEGEYYSKVTIEDENYAEKLNNITITAKVKIIHDVMNAEVSPLEKTSRPGEQSNFTITIHNKGTTGDVFRVWTEGTERFKYERNVYVAPKSTEMLTYAITERDEERHNIKINVESVASNAIHQEQDIRLTVRSDLIGDYKSTNNGLILAPVFEGVIYSIAGFISNLFR